MKHKRIGLESPEKWSDALKGISHSFYHEWVYCKAVSLSSGLETYLHVFEGAEGKAVIVLSERQKLDGFVDLVSPYGFGGFSGDASLLESESLKTAFFDFGISMGYVTAYVMQHPLFRPASDVWDGAVCSQHVLYEIDLRNSAEGIWNRMCKTHRYEIRKLLGNKRIRFLTDRRILSPAFKRLYKETLGRVMASSVYYFCDLTLDSLINVENTILLGVEDDAGIQAVSLFLYTGDSAEYFLNATTVSGRKYSRLLLWKAMETLISFNVRSLNLGGGIKTGDCLDDFKRRFGGSSVTGQALKIVFSPECYRDLCMRYNVESCGTGYFPPYWAENIVQKGGRDERGG